MKISTIQFTLLLAVGSASMLCFSILVKSMLGAERTTDAEESNHNPYVTDGLIAMWDGEWNIGLGIHDSSSPVWVDLVGGYDVNLTSHGSFSDKALVCDGIGCAASANDGIFLDRNIVRTVEICFIASSSVGIITSLSIYGLGQTAETGTIAIRMKNTGTLGLFCMIVNSSSEGKASCITNFQNMNEVLSVSCLYDNNDFIGSYVNGEYRTPSYSFFGQAVRRISFGGRTHDTDIPWQGRIFSVRVYDRNLTEDEIAHNLHIDEERFGQ